MKKNSFRRMIMAICFMISAMIIGQVPAFAETNLKIIKINNSTLEFKQIIYVDDSKGNDDTGDGSKNKPFKTVVKGFDYMNTNCREGGAIVISEGTYDVEGLFKGNSYNLNQRYNKMKISLLAETMGKVEFTKVGEWMVTENSSSLRIKINFYGLVFKSISENYYHLGGDDWTNEYYNCVFTKGYGGWNYAVKDANVKVVNSLFLGLPGGLYSSDSIKGSAINCASTTKNMDPVNGTKTNCIYNVTLDSNYNITSTGWINSGSGTNPDGTVAHIGVYGGSFAWGGKVSEDTSSDQAVGNQVLLIITMVTGERKEYDLTVDKVNDFMAWYNSNPETNLTYTIEKNYNRASFKRRKDYISYSQISSVEVDEYNE